MSIPLDRLYNFLYDRCNRNFLIYHFYPHGSKKPNDVQMLKSIVATTSECVLLPEVVFHDQELLQFDLWHEYHKSFVIPGTTHSRLKTRTSHLNIHDKLLLVHSEKNSPELKKFEDDGAIGVYYWSHALIARDWFRYAEHDPSLTNIAVKNKKFLIYNRAWSSTREYRLTFFEKLIKNNLQDLCLTSFSPTDTGIHYTKHQFKNRKLEISNFEIEKMFPLNTYPSHASADYESNDYRATNVEIVLETIFDDSRIHLTEKSLRPIAVGHPFIICGTTGSLNYLKEYGFKTFSNFWSEEYDTITDPVDRLECIIKLMKYLQSTDIDWEEVKKITSYNQQWFFSNSFHDQIVNEFNTNLNAGLDKLDKFKSGKYFLRNYNFKKSISVVGERLPELYHEIYNMLTNN